MMDESRVPQKMRKPPLPTRLMSPRIGLTHRPSWRLPDQVRAAVVLTGRAMPCHYEHDASGWPRSTTDTHGPLTCGRSTKGARQHEW
jgi:hypothetical protein